MSANRDTASENRLGLPSVLLSLCLLALLVSLFGLFRTSGITQTRVDDLHMSWQTMMEDGVEGAEVLATDRLMQSITRPVPAVHSAARWSLAMGALSLVFFAWLLLTARSVQRGRLSLDHQQARNDQASMAKLLDEMAPLASGDLGVKASVGDGTAGALAQAFNHAVSELQRLAGIQLSTSRSLGESVNQSHQLAAAIEQQCAQQTQHIHQSSNSLLGMSSSTGAWLANAAETSTATKTVVDSADGIATALKASSKQIDSMRRDSDTTLRLMQSMEQHVRSIGDTIVQLEDLARRTDLLAVNTTIRASSQTSDSASTDVGQLTGEVARLAEALSRATGDFNSLTSGMCADTSEAITCVQRFHAACNAQFAQTHSQADALVQIRTHSQATHTHAVNMSEQLVLQAGVVKALSENMNLINQITEQTGQDAQANAIAMEELKKLAADLRQSTSDFNHPDGLVVEDGNQQTKSVARRAAERAAING